MEVEYARTWHCLETCSDFRRGATVTGGLNLCGNLAALTGWVLTRSGYTLVDCSELHRSGRG
ncbi:uncharacterized protein BDZ99DRAFT_457554 [Mytilinidion resinicola]|uniref:Uncharacterized protein n=1 Tax=Mytilinidion resinicola TaxID=574789 RepID=A0A6A6ZCQ7_9PEZI|nr:uncharacterized protein BDZ99DRAFT_457554 [Mytilinidion resinicola]KAF2817987.1 hypothetical protein BDZ99DRAFT_457554 [Mytilinidion resinicola]